MYQEYEKMGRRCLPNLSLSLDCGSGIGTIKSNTVAPKSLRHRGRDMKFEGGDEKCDWWWLRMRVILVVAVVVVRE